MNVANQVQQPGQIVRFQPVRRSRRRQHSTKQCDPLLRIRRGNRRQCSSIGRKRCIDEVPILVHQQIVVASVLRRIRASVRPVSVLASVFRVRRIPLDLIRPGRCNHEDHQVFVVSGSSRHLLIHCRRPIVIFRIQLQQHIHSVPRRRLQLLVCHVSHAHVSAVIPRKCLLAQHQCQSQYHSQHLRFRPHEPSGPYRNSAFEFPNPFLQFHEFVFFLDASTFSPVSSRLV